MTKTLTLDEILDCIEILGDKKQAGIFARKLEAIGDQMRDHLSCRLDVQSFPTRREESMFAGTCAQFAPNAPGQPCPYPLTEYDKDEWEDTE